MKKGIIWIMLSWLIVAAFVLSSCGPATPSEQEEEEEEEEEEPVGEQEEEEEEGEEEEEEPVTGAPQYGGTLTWSYWNLAYLNDMAGWDPQYDWTAQLATDYYFETLLMGDLNRGPRGTNEWSFPNPFDTPEKYIAGRLVESWEVSADKLIFYVRQGMYLTGKSVNPGVGERREFTAEDIKYNADIALPSAIYGWLWDWIDDVEVIDRYTVVFNLNRFKSTWSLHVGYGFGGLEHPTPREVVEAGVTDWKNHYGTGPFLLTNYTSGSAITYERNPEYWATDIINGKEYQLPFVDKVIVPVILDWATKIAALRTGKLDLVNRVPIVYRDSLLDSSPELLIRTYASGASEVIGMQHNDSTIAVKPFTDRRVRKALSAALDRETMVKEIYLEGDVLVWPVGPVAEDVFIEWYDLPEDLSEFYDYNPEYARQLLADAGYPDGFDTELIWGAPTAQEEDLIAMILSYWADIGVDCKLKIVEAGASFAMSATKDFPQMFKYGMGSGDALYMENWANPTANNNVANYNNPELTALFRYGQTLVTVEEQVPTMKEVSLWFLDEHPYIDLPAPRVSIYWWPWLKNYYGEVDAGFFGDATVGARVWLDEDLKEEMGY